MSIKEQIRAEIERRKGYISVTHFAEELLAFLDTRPEQLASEGLEEEIARYLREECSADDEPSISDIARYFAEWGAEHLKK